MIEKCKNCTNQINEKCKIYKNTCEESVFFCDYDEDKYIYQLMIEDRYNELEIE